MVLLEVDMLLQVLHRSDDMHARFCYCALYDHILNYFALYVSLLYACLESFWI